MYLSVCLSVCMEVVACEACPCFTICITIWVAMGTCGLPWIHLGCPGYTWVAMDTCEHQKALKCVTASVLVFLHCESCHIACATPCRHYAMVWGTIYYYQVLIVNFKNLLKLVPALLIIVPLMR